MTALQFGPTDMSYEYGYRLDRTGPSFETLYARSRCVLAARLAGIDSGDAPYWFHQDHLGTLRSALWSFQLGFTHKACHAPEQVQIVHQAYEMVADPNKDWAARYMREAHEDQ
jgi:citrate lyase subunit beta/citryl-CoA lyase